jgi:hypothetical protein
VFRAMPCGPIGGIAANTAKLPELLRKPLTSLPLDAQIRLSGRSVGSGGVTKVA